MLHCRADGAVVGACFRLARASRRIWVIRRAVAMHAPVDCGRSHASDPLAGRFLADFRFHFLLGLAGKAGACPLWRSFSAVRVFADVAMANCRKFVGFHRKCAHLRADFAELRKNRERIRKILSDAGRLGKIRCFNRMELDIRLRLRNEVAQGGWAYDARVH